MSRQDLIRDTMAAQQEVFRTLLDEALPNLLSTDISMAQMRALAVIDRQPNCTIGMLSEQLAVKAPAVSLLVDKLERAALARRVRDVADARRVIVRPTLRGARMLGRVRLGGRAALGRWISRLEDDDLEALRQGILALAALARGFPVDGSYRARRTKLGSTV